MGKVNTKYVGLVACIVAIIFSIALTIGIFVKADEPGDGVKKINYEDDYYNAKVLDVDNKVVEDIYKTYESGNLELTATNNEISYTVDTENSNSIKAVSSALCMSADKNLELDEEVLLYLGEKQDCNYNETTGSAKSEFDNKWILVNGKVPIGMYNEKIVSASPQAVDKPPSAFVTALSASRKTLHGRQPQRLAAVRVTGI